MSTEINRRDTGKTYKPWEHINYEACKREPEQNVCGETVTLLVVLKVVVGEFETVCMSSMELEDSQLPATSKSARALQVSEEAINHGDEDPDSSSSAMSSTMPSPVPTLVQTSLASSHHPTNSKNSIAMSDAFPVAVQRAKKFSRREKSTPAYHLRYYAHTGNLKALQRLLATNKKLHVDATMSDGRATVIPATMAIIVS
eukprot:g71639.t1